MSILSNIKQLKRTLSQEFHYQTKIIRQGKELPINKWPKAWIDINFKGYPRFNALRLSQPNLQEINFEEVLYKRRSERGFVKTPLTENQVSSLLYYSAGVKNIGKNTLGNRFYPSAGGRYPLEIYPIIFNVNSVTPGIYHYYLKNHLLEQLPFKKDFKNKSMKYFGNQSWAEQASLFLVISAIFLRNQVKYGERGYRHVLSEVGSLTQNVYLVSAALNIGCCPTGGYMDDKFNNLLDLDGREESVVAVIAVGNTRKMSI